MRVLAPSLRRAVTAFWLLSVVPQMAKADCDSRFISALEASNLQFEPGLLNYLGRQFVSRPSLNAGWTLDQGCDIGDGYKTRLKASVSGAVSSRHAGTEQNSSRALVRAYLNEAYVTIPVPGEMLIDIGKKDIVNGYLLFLSPLDVLRKPIAPPPHGAINVASPSWRSSYREGSVGMSAIKFLDWGTMELAVFPSLGGDPGDVPVSQWTSLQRTNPSAAVYAAYNANLWKSFNPKVLALATSERHVWGVGISDVLTEGVILTTELARASSSQVHRLSEKAANTLFAGGFPSGPSVLERTVGGSHQLATGVRINGPQKTTLIGEFYYQSDGYRKSDWDRYFHFSEYALAAYGVSGFKPYLDYQRLMLSSAASDSLRNVLLGKRYLTLGLERMATGLERVGWHVSLLSNADDGSSLLNLHLTYQAAPGAEIYVGGRGMFGGQHSDFGRFRQSPLIYFGLRSSF